MEEEIQAESFTPQEREEENEDLLTLSQRFQHKFNTNPSLLSKNVQMPRMRRGAKRKGHSWGSLTKLTGPERSTATRRCKWKMAGKGNFNGLSVGRTSAIMERAAKVQSGLDPEFPSFFKLMHPSHVTIGFWLGFPQDFCRLHLPKSDTTIILEDEDGVEYQTKFLFGKVGLSGGWRGFSLTHKLLEGDVVVFHLVLPCKFKVYIVRGNELAKVDGALTPEQSDDSTSAADFACNDKPIRRCENTNESHQMPLFPDIHQEMLKANDKMAINSYPEEDECANTKAVATLVASEDMDISESSNMSNPFVDLRDFKIIFNGSIINSELSKHLQARYHELCCSRNSYLHEHLKGNCQKLAAGIISETMDIADAIRSSNHSTCLDDYKAWDKTLEAFEMLEMNVGFLRARLNRLIGLMLGSTEEVDSKRYEKASCERDHVEKEIRSLELKLLELKQTSHGLEKEMESVKEKSARYKMMFQEEASAAW